METDSNYQIFLILSSLTTLISTLISLAHMKNIQSNFSPTSTQGNSTRQFQKQNQDELMWIDLDDEESAPMVHQIKDSARNCKGKQIIVIPAFDLYSKEVGDGNGNESDDLRLRNSNLTGQR